MMRRPRLSITVAVLLLWGAASSAHAQAGAIQAGIGTGITQSDDLSGQGWHASAATELPILLSFRIHVDLLYQQGVLTGSPMKCERISLGNCTGRQDRNSIAGVAIMAKPLLGNMGPVSGYVIGGLGAYHRRTRVTEYLLPSDAEGGPDRDVRDVARTSPGYSIGLGMVWMRRGVQPFVELVATRLVEPESMSGAVPVTVGLRF